MLKLNIKPSVRVKYCKGAEKRRIAQESLLFVDMRLAETSK